MGMERSEPGTSAQALALLGKVVLVTILVASRGP